MGANWWASEFNINALYHSSLSVTKIAALVYNIGRYDSVDFLKEKRVPPDIDAFFYTTADAISDTDVSLLQAHGWKVVFTTKQNINSLIKES